MSEFEQQLKDVLSQAYDIERELGGGGMSRVFVATDRVLGRKIVIKLLSPELTADVNRGRFRREIKVAAQLQHPHIVPLLSAGEHEDIVYYTMPFIAGESLKQSVEKNGPLLVNDVVRVLYHVGEALDYAHNAGVVHRDIKPANILRSGTYALVTDFGVAKALNAAMASSGMTSTGMAIGTPAYMAPEQLAGDPAADHRIDIYALGLLAYELLNGRSPYAATTPQRVLAAVLTQDPPPLIDVRPDVPPRLSQIVMSCLSKDPEGRPESARDLLDELDTFSTGSGEIRTMERKIPKVHASPAPTPVITPLTNAPITTPLTNAPVTNAPVSTPVTNTPVTNTPVTNAPVVTTPTANTPVYDAGVSAEPVTSTPAEEQLAVVGEPGEGEHVDADGYYPPKKRSNAKLFSWVAVALAIVAGGIFISTRLGGPSTEPVPANAVPVVTDSTVAVNDSTAVPPPAVLGAAPLPGATGAVPGAVNPDSQAVADSLKKVAAAKKAKADSLKKVAKADSLKRAAAVTDSLNKVRNSTRTKARSAAIWLFADATARKTFTDGATHMGGVLKAKRLGDLQTQINALQPFLARAGLTYAQFKDVAQEAGINMFDEFGRMVPDSVRRLTTISY
jgi:serine/threonine protein kinase